ncbi:MAG: hypothetical protein HYZ27_09685, partial [Deltaproteobacteria bacterium]|nr:hypothetical protein [Deltaproteobacteria bacterium]
MRALGLAAALAAVLLPSGAGAVPAFARQYGTSCQTCHVAFPKNTPFGEAFRRNGYRFPGGRDEDFRRQEPQKLGADAYKDVFPQSVWPGELPAQVPLSVVTQASVTVGSAQGGPSFEGLGGALSLNAATTLGPRISAWAGVTVSAATTGAASLSAERLGLIISAFDRPWLNFRVGRLEPGVFVFSGHRLLGPMPWITTATVGDSPFALEPSQLGVEATGLVLGRGAWALGLVEGSGRFNVPKDAYARLGWKLGGMRLDGEPDDGELDLADPAPWREWSLQVGAFGYLGQTALGTPGVATQDDRVQVVGADLAAHLRDANLLLAWTMARHRRPFLAMPDEPREVHQVLA